MNKKVFITQPIPVIAKTLLEEKGFSVTMYEQKGPLAKEALIAALQQGSYDAVLSLLTDAIDDEVFAASPQTVLYSNYATGFNNIDLVATQARGIVICNAPSDIASEAVAEHTVALLLAAARHIVPADLFTKQGRYTGWDPMMFTGMSLQGKLFGLVGAGRIGAMVARCVSAFGMKVVYTDVQKNDAFEKETGATFITTIDELLSVADVVSLHVPLLPSTHHLLNEQRIALMKPTSILINTARGPVVDEQALVKALQNKTIASAALDVFENEPAIAEALRACTNVILTPHIASATREARDDMAVIAAQNIIDFFDGKKPAHQVTL